MVVKTFFLALLLSLSLQAAEVKFLDDLISEIKLSEQEDLERLLQQVELSATKETINGKTIFKVKSIVHGSAWDRVGLKSGDQVVTGVKKKDVKK